MNWKTILTIAKKDVKEASQNKAVWLPILIVPAIFVLIIPAALIVGFSSAGTALESPLRDPDFAMFLNRMPPFMIELIRGLTKYSRALCLFWAICLRPSFSLCR